MSFAGIHVCLRDQLKGDNTNHSVAGHSPSLQYIILLVRIIGCLMYGDDCFVFELPLVNYNHAVGVVSTSLATALKSQTFPEV